ncbi:hypothetical protein B0H19DRAFT_962275 [Mycena capillaripes]|nr:hypothetical protein B0H19DRAFT_962275 [Mycena capillaripes]
MKAVGGVEWAWCAEYFFDFEKKFGYSEDGSQITTAGRPEVVKRWLGRQQKWDAKADVGEIGAEGTPGTFVDDWWKWWSGVQPEERGNSGAGGVLLRPSDLDWSSLVKLHGRNGLLQVMASLLWWGEALPTESPWIRLGGSSQSQMSPGCCRRC